MISNRAVTALLLIATLVVVASPAAAQYMYLDANGNGVHDPGDQLASNGSPTTVDVWIVTNHNRDGSLAVCDIDGTSPLGINAYAINLLAANGLVSYSGYTDHFGTVAFGELNPGDGLRYKNGFGGQPTFPPGTYRVATLTITGLSGSPRVDIVDQVSGSNDFTMFGTGANGCFGNDFDNTYKLTGPAGGSDWTDVDGLAPATPIDTPPVVNNPGNKTVNEGDCLNFTVTGSAPNGHPISFALILAPPSGASITTGGQFTWCPTEAQGPGIYSVTVSVQDNVTTLTNTATFQVTVNEVNQAPVLSPLADRTVNLGNNLIFVATATDADVPGTGLTFSIAPGAPSGVSITTSGTFGWNPGANQIQPGIYPITIRVTDNGVPPLSDAKTFNVTVQPAGTGAPVVNNPGNMTVQAGTVVDRTVTGSDPNNLPLTFTKGSGSPVFMTVTTTSPTTGNIHLATSITDMGNYVATVVASNGIETGQASFTIFVTQGGGAPVLEAIANMTVSEGDVADQTLHGSDPDNMPLTFTKFSGPLFMTVTTTSPTTGNVHLEPGFADAGSYPATVRASDGSLSTQASFVISVLNVCRAPVANAGGPYSGFIGVPVAFNGTGSSDPDGGALSYAWNFGDGTAGTGATISHTYVTAASYLVTLRVTNPCGRFADAAVTATITSGCFDALAFTQGGNNKTSLGSGRPQTCFQIQPLNDSFTIQDLDLSSLVMISQGTGSVSEIHAVSTKSSLGADKNGDGIDEITACFTKADLQLLFSNIQGTQVVTVRFEGDLFSGGSFCTTLDHTVKAGGGGGNASVRPNPLNPSAVLTFSTSQVGQAKVQLFDTQGRLVKTLMDEPAAAAGYHDVLIDGRDRAGNRLASGVYYVKIHSVEGTEAKAITILK